MARRRPFQQPGDPHEGRTPLEKIGEGMKAIQQLVGEVEDLRQDGFPYRGAMRTRLELHIRETIRQAFGERSPEFQQLGHFRLPGIEDEDLNETLSLLRDLILSLEDQRRVLMGEPPRRPPGVPSLQRRRSGSTTPRLAGSSSAPKAPQGPPVAPPAITQPRRPAPPVSSPPVNIPRARSPQSPGWVPPFPPAPPAQGAPPQGLQGHSGSRAALPMMAPEAIRTVLSRLRKIGDRFHFVARQLRSRSEYRATVHVEDERDVQDLFHALLWLEFDDITIDEWMPPYSPGTQQIAFLVEQGQFAVLPKKTRPGMGKRELAQDLAADVQRYRRHSACVALFSFVYDPEGRLGDPRALESELAWRDRAFQVEVLIGPK